MRRTPKTPSAARAAPRQTGKAAAAAPPSPSRRPPGRPPQQTAADHNNDAVRQALLHCAREQFAQHGYAGVSLRRLAAEVGVNAAMVHYYFGNKQGLFLTILAEHVEPLIRRLEQALADTQADGHQTLREFFTVFTRTLSQSPWLPGLVLREVLPEQGALHQVFVERFARRGGGLLRALVEREQQRGALPATLDPSITALTLASQIWFPFIARPLATQVFDCSLDARFCTALVDQILRGLYGESARPKPAHGGATCPP